MKLFVASLVCLLTLTRAVFAGEAVRPPDPSPNQNIADLLAHYAQLTGKKIICDPNVNGPAYLVLPPDAANEKKVELIEKQMFLNGFSLIDSGEDVLEVLGVGKQVRSTALPIYTKPEELPRGERIVSFAFKVEHRDPAMIATVLAQYYLPSNANGFTPDSQSRTLIVTGQTAIIRAILKLMPLLDVAPDPVHKEAADARPIRPLPVPVGAQ